MRDTECVFPRDTSEMNCRTAKVVVPGRSAHGCLLFSLATFGDFCSRSAQAEDRADIDTWSLLRIQDTHDFLVPMESG